MSILIVSLFYRLTNRLNGYSRALATKPLMTGLKPSAIFTTGHLSKAQGIMKEAGASFSS